MLKADTLALHHYSRMVRAIGVGLGNVCDVHMLASVVARLVFPPRSAKSCELAAVRDTAKGVEQDLFELALTRSAFLAHHIYVGWWCFTILLKDQL